MNLTQVFNLENFLYNDLVFPGHNQTLLSPFADSEPSVTMFTVWENLINLENTIASPHIWIGDHLLAELTHAC